MWNEASPDKRTAFSISSEPYIDGTSLITTFTSTLDITGKCNVTATQVFTTQKSCNNLRETTMKKCKFYGEIASSSIYQEATGEIALIIYLTPTAGGCLLVKRFVG